MIYNEIHGWADEIIGSAGLREIAINSNEMPTSLSGAAYRVLLEYIKAVPEDEVLNRKRAGVVIEFTFYTGNRSAGYGDITDNYLYPLMERFTESVLPAERGSLCINEISLLELQGLERFSNGGQYLKPELRIELVVTV
jgi:hypothetical protein